MNKQILESTRKKEGMQNRVLIWSSALSPWAHEMAIPSGQVFEEAKFKTESLPQLNTLYHTW